MNCRIWLLLAAIILCIGCHPDGKHRPTAPVNNLELLKQLEAATHQKPYGVHSNILWLDAQKKYYAGDTSKPTLLQYIYNSISSNHPDTALFLLNRHGSQLDARLLESTQALAYFRQAELNNCIAQCHGNMCIFPRAVGTVQARDTASVIKAANLYYKLWTQYADSTALWMLQICKHQYPKSVRQFPASIFIDVNLLEQTTTVPEFENIAPKLNVNTRTQLGGAALDDFNGDGLVDIFTTNYNLTDSPTIYFQQKDGSFKNQSAAANMGCTRGGSQCIHADYDNDGDNDILIVRGGWMAWAGNHPVSLLENDGKGVFTDVAPRAGIGGLHPCHTAHFADFNNDGWLDIIVGNEQYNTGANNTPHFVQLFLSNGRKKFTDVAKHAGIQLNEYVKGVTVADYNLDGKQDVFFSIYGSPNKLFKNIGNDKNGISQFKDVSTQAGIAEPIFSFPCGSPDINNDGLPDLVVFSYNPEKIIHINDYLQKPTSFQPYFYLNKGSFQFEPMPNNGNIHFSIPAMGFSYGDVNNDGYLDLYATTGGRDFNALVPNVLLINQAGKSFANGTAKSRTGNLQKGHGVSFADIDNDGNIDLYVSMGGFFDGDVADNQLFRNTQTTNQSVTIKLQGTKTNRSAIGVRIKATSGKQQIYREVNQGGSYGSNSLVQVIGIGNQLQINELEVFWNNKQTQTFKALKAGNTYLIEEGSSKVLPILPH